MQLNPIVKKDIRVQARSMRICWSVFAYEAIMALVFFIAMLTIESSSYYSTDNIYSRLVWLYPVLGVTQIVVLGVVVPIRTASSISGEKERQTFDIMMTTSMTPFSIIMGKVTSAIVQDLFFVAGSLPVMALAFVSGGLPWSYLLWFFAVSLLVSLFSASIGIWCSSICKRSITAVILAYAIYVMFFVGTFLPMWVTGIYYAANGSGATMGTMSMLPLLLNPVIYLIEFFSHVMTGQSTVYNMFDLGIVHVNVILEFLTSWYWWLLVSTLLFAAVSFLFLWLASKRIDPIRKNRKPKGVPVQAVTGRQQGV